MYKLFTDGSCVPNPGFGGFGYILVDNKDEAIILGKGNYPNTTSNRMEAIAMYNALVNIRVQILPEINMKGNKLAIYSDSQITVKICRNEWKATKNTEIFRDIKEEMQNPQWSGISIEFEWVKGHSGIYFNEIADRLSLNNISPRVLGYLLSECKYTHNPELCYVLDKNPEFREPGAVPRTVLKRNQETKALRDPKIKKKFPRITIEPKNRLK